MTDSPLERVLALAAVAPYRRVEHGRVEQVRGYLEHRIPEPDWLKGQREWVARGEAAWKARGASARQQEHAGESAEVSRKVTAEAAARTASDRKNLSPGTHEGPAAPAYAAAARSGLFPDSDLEQLRSEIVALKAQLSEATGLAWQANQRIGRRERAVMLEKRYRNESRAKLALELLFLVGTLVYGAISGGLGFVATLAVAAAMLPDAARSLTTYHLAEKESGIQRLLAHPIRRTHVAVSGRGKPPPLPPKPPDTKLTAIQGGELALSQPAGLAAKQTARILRMALISNGLPREAAVPVADEIARRVELHHMKRMTARA